MTGPSGSLPSHGRTDAPTETGRRGPWARGGGAPPQPVVGSEKARATSRQSQGAPLTPDQLRNVRPVTPDRAPVCRARAAPWSRPSQGPDILECEVKWALGSITTNKASGGDGIPTQLFKILK